MAVLFRLSCGGLRSVFAAPLQLPSVSVAALGRRLLCAESGSREQVDSLVKKDKVVVFIKGTPAQPMCGFSNAVVQILRMHGVEEYAAYNVLVDQDLRQGVKNYSNWPTIPQVFFNGEFVGGCDILLQMHQNGDLVEELKKLGIHSALLDVEQEKNKK
ncbi:glutaredoxin-related protein 5, mitochondrial [Latimeria chalumnae]|uniref:Glutaredoxin-related protein 5, mitochondrial n=1 Tax=Latimeria chalumnae TaxID=7897 RepID=H3AVF5_LATCH|nr:PREDICTED: glutaredoxin-related protein 5, mitochondrial [Latimeria chalumnae]|eukprot:XP_006003965.1 PREDICTED: glutaredoxin-related protein 5, mitochondrial [Latimeria chalumnae]